MTYSPQRDEHGSGGYGPGGQPGPGGYGPPPGYAGPSGYGPPQGAAPPRRRRFWPWYLVGVLLIVVGIASIVVGVASFGSGINSLATVPASSGGTVTLSHAGGNIVYFQKPAGQPDPGSINLEITPASAGAKVADLHSYGPGTSTFDLNGRQGVAVFTVQVVHPGRFDVSVTTSNTVPGGSIGIGPGVGGRLIVAVLVGVLLILAGAVLMGILTVLLILRRSRFRLAGAGPVR